MRTDHVDKKTAKWCTDWNLCILNHIILPLFIQLLEYLHDNQSKHNFGVTSYLNLFPDKKVLDEMLKPYFEPMYTSFYKRIYDLCLIPTKNQNNNFVWYKPEELHFSTELNTFLLCLKNWSQEFDNSIFKIIENMDIPICRRKHLISKFKDNSNIELTILQPIHLIDRFKVKFLLDLI